MSLNFRYLYKHRNVSGYMTLANNITKKNRSIILMFDKYFK